MNLKNKKILLGVTGGIACYKSLEIVRRLRDLEAEVSVVMTDSAREFIQPLTFQTLSNQAVGTSLFDPLQEEKIGHIAQAQTADLVLVAPATANILGKIANGIADDLLSTILLATTAPVYIAPAMNDQMWKHPATQRNLSLLRDYGIKVIDPESGFLACGTQSIGRMAEPETIVKWVLKHWQEGELLLKGTPILITAGPTREKIDPVRYLSNYSSGKMGYALASVCASMGADVTLVSGPVVLDCPLGVKRISVESTEEMYQAVMENAAQARLIIKAAAVADYRVATPSVQKQKKKGEIQLELIQNPDILKELGRRKKKGQCLVGFAAESERLLDYAEKKLIEKNLDLIVANNITQEGAGFDVDTNIITLVDRNGIQEFPQLTKLETAREIIQFILQRFHGFFQQDTA